MTEINHNIYDLFILCIMDRTNSDSHQYVHCEDPIVKEGIQYIYTIKQYI